MAYKWHLEQSDYTAGYTPNLEVQEPLRLLPLGDMNEAMLNEALFQITGSRTGRPAVAEPNRLTGLGSSIQRKAGGGQLIKSMSNVKTSKL